MEMAFTAHFFHIPDLDDLENWSAAKLHKWYARGVKLHNYLNWRDSGASS